MRRLIAATAVSLAATGGQAAAAQPPCDRPLAPGDHTVALQYDGRSRPFLLYVPPSYDGHARLPLVLNLHGSTLDGPEEMAYSDMRTFAARNGYAVAAPTGSRTTVGGGYDWSVPGAPPTALTTPGSPAADDVGYLLAVLDATQAVMCQDAARVIATGWSGGARMSSALGCVAADRIAAIVPDAGLRAGPPREGSTPPAPGDCAPARPVPVLSIHGTDDPINPYAGGGSNAAWGYSVAAALERWREIDRCRPTPVETTIRDGLTHVEFPGCADGTAVELYRVDGGGHRWFRLTEYLHDPRLVAEHQAFGPDPHVIDATQVVTDAVKRFRIRPPAVVLRRRATRRAPPTPS